MTAPKDLALREAEFLLYQTEDGRTRVEVRFGGETAWLSLTQMADLFQRDKSVISRHIKNVFEEGELRREAVVAEFATTAADGKTYQVEYFNLDVIISVGYRVKSHRGTQFRIWATQRLREYIVKGFTLDDERLKRAGGGNYFDELLARIRDIRSSEKVFWRKVLEIYATSIDYDARAEASQRFFATLQNKMHWAVHGQTAAEVISARADGTLPNMGMTSWTGERTELQVSAPAGTRRHGREGTLDPQVPGSSPRGVQTEGPGQHCWPGPLSLVYGLTSRCFAGCGTPVGTPLRGARPAPRPSASPAFGAVTIQCRSTGWPVMRGTGTQP